MKSSSQRNFTAGLIFACILAAGFIVIALFIKLRGKNEGSFNSYTLFKSASGLQAGYKVWLNGVTVGTVATVEILGPTVVRVNMTIDTVYRKYIHRDALAKLGSAGLMGDNLISIIQGNSKEPVIGEGDSIKALQPPDFSKAMKRAVSMGKQMSSLSTEFKQITEQFSSGHGTVSTLLKDKKLKTDLKTTVETARKSIGRVKSSVSSFKK